MTYDDFSKNETESMGGFLAPGMERVELVTDRPHDQDTLGLRLSGNRSVGVFVCSIQSGSLADKVKKCIFP